MRERNTKARTDLSGGEQLITGRLAQQVLGVQHVPPHQHGDQHHSAHVLASRRRQRCTCHTLQCTCLTAFRPGYVSTRLLLDGQCELAEIVGLTQRLSQCRVGEGRTRVGNGAAHTNASMFLDMIRCIRSHTAQQRATL